MFKEVTNNGISYMTATNIHTKHAFTTRFGGVSRGIFESLNLGLSLGDDTGSVKENYSLICGALAIDEKALVRTNQVHGALIRVVSSEDRGKIYLTPDHESDGLATRETGVALIVYTGDCVPILLHDPVKNAIGAVHAGWRGTTADIAGAAVKKMSDEFGCSPENIKAAIGPCISRCCYETGRDVTDSLVKALGTEADRCISERGGKYMVDLKEANRHMLVRAGLTDITISDECTSCSSDKYWSHRKTKGRRGSQAAIIAL